MSLAGQTPAPPTAGPRPPLEPLSKTEIRVLRYLGHRRDLERRRRRHGRPQLTNPACPCAGTASARARPGRAKLSTAAAGPCHAGLEGAGG
jgi:hypothetical protein